MAEKRTGKKVSKPTVDTNKSKGQENDDTQEPLKTLTNFLTVEPIMVIQMSTAILAYMAVQDLIFEKACKVDFAYSDEICSTLKTG